MLAGEGLQGGAGGREAAAVEGLAGVVKDGGLDLFLVEIEGGEWHTGFTPMRESGPGSLGAEILRPGRSGTGRGNAREGEASTNGTYLCELEAQPGGPEGRPHTTAGSEPIRETGRPRDVRPCSPVLVLGAIPSHLVPSPVSRSRSHRRGPAQAPGSPRTVGLQVNHARYNDAGGLLAETYPSGRVVSYGRDERNRVTGVTSGGTTYASGVAYAAHGAVAEMKLGALWETQAFNGRLQPVTRRVGTVNQGSDVLQLTLAYGADNANNGNVASQRIQIPGLDVVQDYGYDGLNRMASVQEKPFGGAAHWSRSFGYAEPGNGYVSNWAGLAPEAFTPVSAANFNAQNQLLIQGSSYDVAGNQTAIGGYTFTWDGEGQLRTALLNGQTTTYRYDGEGRRVRKEGPGGATVDYAYDAGGALVAEYGGTAETETLQYVFVDHLGSTRLMAKPDGMATRRIDYQPFGEILRAGVGGRTTAMGYETVEDPAKGPIRFTGKERDAETGLDYFGARYMSAAQGRFTSPDEPLADQNFSYPQSWNLYAYGRNNPLRFFDLDGRKCVQTSNGQADDGTGGGCEAAGVDKNGKITPQQVNVQAFEPPSPLLLAVATGAQRAEGPVNAIGIATGVVMTGGAVGVGVGAIGGTGLISLSIGATRVATLTPLLLPAGQKLGQIIARLGEGQQNPQLVLQKLTELRAAASAAGTAVQGFYIQSGATIYRVGENYLTVSGQGKILSYVQGATPATGVAQRYLELGGK